MASIYSEWEWSDRDQSADIGDIVQQLVALHDRGVVESWQTDSWIPRTAAPLPSATRINVVDYGANPTGASDDTEAFKKARDAAKHNTTLYVPAGQYNIHEPIVFLGLNGFSMEGDGPDKSIIKRLDTYWKPGQAQLYFYLVLNGKTDPKLFRFRDCNDLCIRNIAFDSFGTPTFGGISIDTSDVTIRCQRVNVTNTRYFNSAHTPPLSGKDRYAWFFRKCDYVWFTNNVVEDLQTEFNSASHVLIEKNIDLRSVKSPGIGFLNLGDGVSNEHITVRKNYFGNSPDLSMGMVTFMLDPPNANHCIWRNIDILSNIFVYSVPSVNSHAAIRIGTGDSSRATVGNKFERFRIMGNRIYRPKDPLIGYGTFGGYIWHNVYVGTGDQLNYSNIEHNRLFVDAFDTKPFVTIGKLASSVGLVQSDNLKVPYETPPSPPALPLPV